MTAPLEHLKCSVWEEWSWLEEIKAFRCWELLRLHPSTVAGRPMRPVEAEGDLSTFDSGLGALSCPGESDTGGVGRACGLYHGTGRSAGMSNIERW